MSQSKIEIKVGTVQFVGEGEQEWLGSQLDKLLDRIPELLKIELSTAPPIVIQDRQPQSFTDVMDTKNIEVAKAVPTNLPTFLKEKNATNSQVNKFLLTAYFLQASGKTRLTTGEVAAALKGSMQSKLANASENLNQNVGKGFCEKDGNTFFVTQHGLDYVESIK
ncbi:hypothetical protein [Pedobacter sp.]|uniref:hypothetical protein n=1 Tax=Pedobacter sp. TaxID=1411316 RepID=UPI0031D3CABC